MDLPVKYCKMCKKSKSLECFNNNNLTCIVCLERSGKKYFMNAEQNRENAKEYHQNYRDRINARKKLYRENNKDKLKEAQQEYRKKMYHCPLCNYEIKFYKKSQHEKSQIHQNHLKQKLEENE